MKTIYMVTHVFGKATNTGRSDYFRVYRVNETGACDITRFIVADSKLRFSKAHSAITMTGFGYSKSDAVMDYVRNWAVANDMINYEIVRA